MFNIILTSKHGQTVYPVDSTSVHEQLRQIGLEYKTSDYLHNSTVVIVIQPVEVTDHLDSVKNGLRAIAEQAEHTLGTLSP